MFQRMADFLLRQVKEAAHARCRQRIVHVKFARNANAQIALISSMRLKFDAHEIMFTHIANVIRCKISACSNEKVRIFAVAPSTIASKCGSSRLTSAVRQFFKSCFL